MSIYRCPLAISGDLLDSEAHPAVSSELAESMLLSTSTSEELDVVEVGHDSEITKPTSSVSPACGELLDVMTRTKFRLNLTIADSPLDFLAGHDHPSPVSLPDLNTEVERSWKNPYWAHIFPFQHSNYTNVEVM